MRIRDIPYLPWIIAVVVLFSIVNVLVRPQVQPNTVAIDENQTVIVAPTSVAQTDEIANQQGDNRNQENISTNTAIAQPTRTLTTQDDVAFTQTLPYNPGMQLHSFDEYRDALLDAIRQRQTLFVAEYVGPPNELAQIYDAIKNYYHPRRFVTAVAQSKTRSPQIRLQLTYPAADKEESFVQQRVSEIVAELVTPGMHPHQKIRVLHDWVVLNTQYDTTFKRYSAYDILNGGSAVCQGYALLMDALLNEAGFNTIYVTGTIKPEFRVKTTGVSDGGHAWNMVQVDGKWYHLDATWDDPMPDRPGVVRYNYYMLTDDEIGLTRTIDNDFSSYLRPHAVTLYADHVLKLTLQDPIHQSQINQIINDLQIRYMEDIYLFGRDDGARFEYFVRNSTDDPFVFRAKTKEDVEPLIKRYVQVRKRSVQYSFTEYMRTHDTNDVIIEVREEQN